MMPLIAGVLGGCDVIGIACTDELRPNVVVEVRDAATGDPAARGATGLAEHTGSGVVTELFGGFHDLILHGAWSAERAGRYRIVLRKPGYRADPVTVNVDEGACHVETRRVTVELHRDTAAIPVPPVDFERGQHVGGYPASVGVRVFGDTLVLAGRAAARCTHLELFAFRRDRSWHIQLQPAQWLSTCSTPGPYQQFQARFQLIPGAHQLLITDAGGPPTVLFSGSVVTHSSLP